ncbi:MAG: flagellin [Candidatus Korobacteraceae bacterium]
MALSILNNITSLVAQNQLNVTQSSLQKTLLQLSSGSRINSGADDAAGLAIADGLNANVTALTQSARNATDGVSLLQVADGAMSQVTTLLNRAVTLATESATGTVNDTQRVALNAEFTSIKSEIDRIGSNTLYNGSQVFGGGAAGLDKNNWASATAGLTTASAMNTGDTITLTDSDTGKSQTYTAVAGDTVATMLAAFNSSTNVNVTAGLNANGNVVFTDKNGNGSIFVTDTSTTLGAVSEEATAASNTVYLSDGTGAGSSPITVTIGTLSAASVGFTGTPVDLTTTDLSTAADAQTALSAVTSAISNVAADRGNLGAVSNRLQSASTVINTQIQNLSSAENGITAADIGQDVSDMAKYTILQQTGIAALQQSNQMQQSVLKLLQ